MTTAERRRRLAAWNSGLSVMPPDGPKNGSRDPDSCLLLVEGPMCWRQYPGR